MHRLLDAQAQAGVTGIHLVVATANLRAIGFYDHLGFTTLRVAGSTTIMGRTLTA
jgi:ribosomal protein S18 acetylase RimI-like enzyme